VYPLQDGEPGAARNDVDYGTWRVLLDGAPEPNRSHGNNPVPSEPVGVVSVRPLRTLQTPLAVAHASLRTLFLPGGGDPLAGTATVPVTDLVYQEVDLDDHWGSLMTGSFDTGPGPVRQTQLAFFDDGGERLYVVHIMCSTECFARRQAEIDGILDSFTLEG
jgi:hypothetical protein